MHHVQHPHPAEPANSPRQGRDRDQANAHPCQHSCNTRASYGTTPGSNGARKFRGVTEQAWSFWTGTPAALRARNDAAITTRVEVLKTKHTMSATAMDASWMSWRTRPLQHHALGKEPCNGTRGKTKRSAVRKPGHENEGRFRRAASNDEHTMSNEVFK